MKIKRIIIGLLLTVYLLVAVFLTACLLTYNDYKISVFGDKSFVIVKNNDFEPDYKKGSLLIITKNNNDDIKVNDEVFFYNTYKNQVSVSHSKVVKVEKVHATETTYTLDGDFPISSEYVIGKADTTKVINNVGTYMSALESRWGFLFMIVLPISVLFIYEIYIIVKEIVRPEEENEKTKEVKDEPKKENVSVVENKDNNDNQEKTEVRIEENVSESSEKTEVKVEESASESPEKTEVKAEESVSEETKNNIGE